MITLILALLISAANAAILPPGFILREFQATKANVLTMKIEDKVAYSNITFNETVWFKNPDKIKIYVEKDGEGLIFVRNGQKCSVMTSGSRVISQELCKKNTGKNFYYDVLTPYGNFISYLKSVGIKTNYEETEIQKIKNDYVRPENVFILREDKDPIYVIGITDDIYKSALSDAKNDKKNISDKLLYNIKEKAPQVWIQTTTNYPVRIYGKTPDGDKTIEILLDSYRVDGNDFPFPWSIKLSGEGANAVSYGVSSAETNTGVIDEQVFNISGYAAKFPKTIDEAALTGNKKVLFNYLKEYR
ncbi:MAG: hypothetical protein NTY22_00630 [Proteobacteria bacterium]|nr:hypothetical protein [Pseudomonadota bacterium]